MNSYIWILITSHLYADIIKINKKIKFNLYFLKNFKLKIGNNGIYLFINKLKVAFL